MDWQTRLIGIYLFLCEQYEAEGRWLCQRLSNNSTLPEFDDVEVLTIFVFGLMEGHRTVKGGYRMAEQFMGEWFPKLPTYQGFAARLNALAEVFGGVVEALLRAGYVELANATRSNRAKVAPEVAVKSYCASKKTYYYGVKLHVTAGLRTGALPVPCAALVTSATVSDLIPLRTGAAIPPPGLLLGDKAYLDAGVKTQLQSHQVTLLTPFKKRLGQSELSLFEQLQATTVSRLRQPIESLFNWINEKTGLQNASKVRSSRGLYVHVFGRLTAALLMLVHNL
jgi:hypothetical protein